MIIRKVYKNLKILGKMCEAKNADSEIELVGSIFRKLSIWSVKSVRVCLIEDGDDDALKVRRYCFRR